MRRSKLETYINILQVLSYRGPLELTDIMYKVNVDYSILKGYLNVLIKQGLLEERSLGRRRVVYAITEKGRSVCALKQAKNPSLERQAILKTIMLLAQEIRVASASERQGQTVQKS